MLKVAITSKYREEVDEIVDLLRFRYRCDVAHEDSAERALSICSFGTAPTEVQLVFDAVELATGVPLPTKGQGRESTIARQIAAWVLRKKYGWGYRKIAAALGRQSHKSGMDLAQAINSELRKGEPLSQLVGRALAEIKKPAE